MSMGTSLEVKEILAFYDFPQLFIGESKTNEIYICLAYDDRNYLCTNINNEELENFKKKNIDLLSLILDSDSGYYFSGEFIDEDKFLLKNRLRNLSKSMLPDSGFYI